MRETKWKKQKKLKLYRRKQVSAFAALVLAFLILAGNLMPALADPGETELFVSEEETADMEMQQQNENFVAGSTELVGLNAGIEAEDFSSKPKEEEDEQETDSSDTPEIFQEEEALVEFTDGTEALEQRESSETEAVPIFEAEEELAKVIASDKMPGSEEAAAFVSEENNSWLFLEGMEVRSGEVDFTQMITAVKIQHRENQWSSWQEVTEETELKLQEQLEFELQYTVPGNTLSADKRTIVYQLPEKFKIIKPAEGNVLNDNGTIRGVYRITENGRIEITFEELYVEQNHDGHEIEGFIRFESKVSEIDRDNGTDTEISFNDRVQISIKTEEEILETPDLQVTKEASLIDKETDTITYEVKVSSQNGTMAEVTLQDVMTNVTLEGELRVKDKNSNPAVIEQPSPGKAGFQITLPKMEAGQEYTITYTGKPPEPLKNGTVFHNRVTASSKDDKNGLIQDTAETTTHYETIKKEGIRNPDGTITWKITVNPGKADISGYILEDLLNGTEFQGEAVLTDSNGVEKSISFPYTFPPESCDAYTITYTTSQDRPLGETGVTNKAVLKKADSDPGDSSENSVWIGENNPLTKQGTGCAVNSGGTVNLGWRVRIEAKNGGSLEAPWTYQDTPGWGQWFTEEQKTQIEETLKKVLKENSYKVKFIESEETGKYSGYTITCQDLLQPGDVIEFSYTTTAKLDNQEQGQYFSNVGKVNDKYCSYGGNQYTPAAPVIVKEDALDAGKAHTGHEYGNLPNGELQWKLKVTVPQSNKEEPIIIEEKLPEDLGLTSLQLTIPNMGIWNTDIEPGSNQVSWWNGSSNDTCVIERKDQGEVIQITLPSDQTKVLTGSMELLVRAEIQNPEDWPTDSKGNYVTKIFTNTASVKAQNSQELGTASQTQEISRNHFSNAVMKEGKSTGDNKISYSLTINPESENLVLDTDRLILRDQLTYEYNPWYSKATVSLVPGSVKIYQRNSDGTKGAQLPVESCPYTYTEERNGPEGGSQYCTNTLIISVPDRQALIVEYDYLVKEETGTGLYIFNKAALEGILDSGSDNAKDMNIEIKKSAAGVDIDGVSLCKVDGENNGITLAGARFRLSAWDGKISQYIPVTDKNGAEVIYITAADGTVALPDLKGNTSYRLEEVEAPSGYELLEEPIYFVMVDEDKTENPDNMPSDFQGKRYRPGEMVYVGNTKATSVVLPETGGFGELLCRVGGIGLIFIWAGAYLEKKVKKQAAGKEK